MTAADRRDGAGSLAAGLCFAAATWALYGYGFGASANHAFYLPAVLARLDPALYRGDPAVAAQLAGPLLFWRWFAEAARLVGLERAALWLWLLSRGVAGWATYRGARALGGSPRAAACSVLLAALAGDLFIDSALAGDPMLKGYLDQTSFFWPFALCAVTLYLEERELAGCIVLGLLALLNPLLAAALAVWLVLALLRRKPRRAAQATALFALCAAPGLLPALAGGARSDMALLSACSPQNFLASAWPVERWLKLAGAGLLWLALFRRQRRAPQLLTLLGAASALWAASIAAAFLPAAGFLLALQFFRLDVAFAWLAALAAGDLIDGMIERPEPRVVAAGAAALLGLAAPDAGPLVAAWAALTLLLERPALGAAGLAGLAYGAWSLFLPADALWRTPPSSALGVAALGGLALWASLSKARAWPRAAAAAALTAALAAGAGPVLAAALLRPAGAAPNGLAAWARRQRPDAMFIVPPDTSGFRLASRHPVFAEWTDDNLALWDPAAAADWKSRMSALGLDWETFPAAHRAAATAWEAALIRRRPPAAPNDFPVWGPADAPRLAALARRTGAGYVVAAAGALPWTAAACFDGLCAYAPPEPTSLPVAGAPSARSAARRRRGP